MISSSVGSGGPGKYSHEIPHKSMQSKNALINDRLHDSKVS